VLRPGPQVAVAPDDRASRRQDRRARHARRGRRDAVGVRDRRVSVDRDRHRRGRGARRSAWSAGPDDRGAAANRAVARVRSRGGRPRRDRRVLSAPSGDRRDDHDRDRPGGRTRVPDFHRVAGGRGQAPGRDPGPPMGLPGPEHREPVDPRRGAPHGRGSGRPSRCRVPVPDRRSALARGRGVAGDPDRRRRHAHGDLAAQRLRRGVGLDDGVRPEQQPADRRRSPRRIERPVPVDRHVQGDEQILRQRAVRRLRGHVVGGCRRATAGPQGGSGGDRLPARLPPGPS
jgi:hypothetical protein